MRTGVLQKKGDCRFCDSPPFVLRSGVFPLEIKKTEKKRKKTGFLSAFF